MSITFTLCRVRDDGVQDSVCPNAEAHRACAGTCTDPEDFAYYGICECVEANLAACTECSLQVNVCNGNAIMLLERLGFDGPDEYGCMCGIATGEDLIARAMLGNVGRDDDGVDPFTENPEATATIHHGGIRAGYFGDRLGAIADLAAHAAREGLLVSWG